MPRLLRQQANSKIITHSPLSIRRYISSKLQTTGPIELETANALYNVRKKYRALETAKALKIKELIPRLSLDYLYASHNYYAELLVT